MATRTEIIKLYIGYYDRAPDATGLAYWETEGADLAEDLISDSFAEQAETKAKYPDTLTTTEFVNAIYQNVFNRDADPDGLVYWVTALDDGEVSQADMILAVMNGALGDDKATLDNKIVVGDDFAESALEDYDNAVSIMDGITADEATVTAAATQIDTWAEDSVRFDLTTVKDVIVGTDADNVINGVTTSGATATFQSLDDIDGGAGTDTLKLVESGPLAASKDSANTTVKNVEVLDITDNHTGAFAFGVDMENFDATIDSVKFSGSSAGVALIATKNTDSMVGASTGSGHLAKHVIADVEIAKSALSSVSVNYEAAAVAGTSDAMGITMTSTTVQTFVTNGIETLNIHAASNATLKLLDTALTTVSIDGSGTLSLDSTAAATFATTIDASAATGNITIAAASKLFDIAVGTTYKGGSAIDDITGLAGNDTISGGAGNDDLDAAGGNNTVSGDAGNDKLTTAGGNDTINGGAGNDTIVTTGGTNKITGGTGLDSITLGAAGAVDTVNFANSGDTGITLATSDTIITFVKTEDKIDFDSMAAGNGTGAVSTDGSVVTVIDGETFVTNTVTIANYTEALAAANLGLSTFDSVVYSYQSTAAVGAAGTFGYLFIDTDGNGAADESIIFNDLGLNGLAAGDIIA